MSELLDWLFARQRFGVKLGLDRVKNLLEHLANPQLAFECVLVGGTNGKGSTAATLASILNASGRSTGLFTSPHLSRFEERFNVNAETIAEAKVLDALSRIKPYAEEQEATFFEIVVVLGCTLFAEAKVEIAIIEVGMGGLNDATNALEPVLSLITNVALDHTRVLGETVEEIALKKSGIMRSGKLCISAAVDGAASVLKAEAKKKNCELLLVGEDITVSVLEHSWQGLKLKIHSPKSNLVISTNFLGKFQAQNLAIAVAAAEVLGITKTQIQEGSKNANWPGRLEIIEYQQRRFLLDGAHNPAASKALSETFVDLKAEPLMVVFGVNRDKEIKALLDPLIPFAKAFLFTQAELSPRAASANELSKSFPESFAFDRPSDAINYAISQTKEDDLILVAGSLYLVGEVRPILLGEATQSYERWQ